MRIKSLLIEVAFKKSHYLNLSSLPVRELKERVRTIWRKELPPPSTPEVVNSVDGSRNRKSYAGYVIYALGAGSLEFVKGCLRGESYLAEVDVLKPEEYSDSRLRTLMGILEVKAALRAVERSQVLLIDGSVVGDVLRPTVFNYEVEENLRGEVQELFEGVKCSFSFESIDSKRFYPELEKLYKGRDFAVAAGYLEYLEYLYSLYTLLERGRGKIVAISKRSDSRHYGLDPLLPDITAIYLSEPPDGYSEPYQINLLEKKFSFPGEFEEKLKKYSFKAFYFKVGRGVYKCETDLPVEESLSLIRFYEVKGYPFPLREVHSRVKITNSDMEKVIQILKHRGITGREALGE